VTIEGLITTRTGGGAAERAGLENRYPKGVQVRISLKGGLSDP